MKSEGGRSDSRLIFGYPVNNANIIKIHKIYYIWVLNAVECWWCIGSRNSGSLIDDFIEIQSFITCQFITSLFNDIF